MMYKVGITGGIGSGKSTICRHFAELGIPIYNSDQRAKELMTNSVEVRRSIVELFGSNAYNNGELNRGFLAEQVFFDCQKRESLNNIVHPAVVEDFKEWVKKYESEESRPPYIIMECALLFDSKMSELVDSTLAVLTPEPMRITRVMERDGASEEHVKARIEAQLSDERLHELADHTVVNIFEEDIEGSVKRLDQIFKHAVHRATDQS